MKLILAIVFCGLADKGTAGKLILDPKMVMGYFNKWDYVKRIYHATLRSTTLYCIMIVIVW